MWKFKLALAVAGSLLMGQMVSAASSGPQATLMAQNTATPERPPGRDVLAAGAGTIADGKSPATLSIDVGKEPLPARPKLELTLAPASIVPNEKYLIVVSLKPRQAPPRRLGAASFFPARPGTDTVFYFDATPIAAELKASRTTTVQLSVALVPVERSRALTASAVRIVGARLVGG